MYAGFAEKIVGGVGLIANEDVVLERKSKLAVGEIFTGHDRMVEPLEEKPEGEES